MSENNPQRYLKAGELLDKIRQHLDETPADDMTLLLKIFRDLKTVDAGKMSPRDASRWLIQEDTEREKRHTEFAIQTGFNRGIKYGLLIGVVAVVFTLALLSDFKR